MSRFIQKICFLLVRLAWMGILLGGGSDPLLAAAVEDQAPLSVKAEINQAVITIGDPVEYTVTIRHSPSVKVLSQMPAPAQDILKLKKVEDIKRTEDKQIVEGRKFILTAFKLGEFILDPVQIEYRTSEGKTGTLTTDRLYLTVKSVAQGEEKTDIRGLKPVLPFAANPLLLFLILLAVTLTVSIFLYLRRQRFPEEPAASETVRSLEEAALSQLNQLFDSDLIRRGKIKEYYLKLSEILRAYFEKRYRILAIESTTCEILRALAQKDTDRSLRQKIEEVLNAADLAKFAKWIPEPLQIILLNQKSKQLVEESRPAEAVPRGI